MAEIPQKYRNPDGSANVEAMLESISHFEKGQHTPPPNQTPPAQAQATMTAESLRPYLMEYASNGTLSPSSAAAIETLYGYPAGMASAYVGGLVAQARQSQQQVLQSTGLDEESFKSLHEWGKQALTPAQQQAFSASARSEDPTVVTQAIQWLQAQHQAAQAGPLAPQVPGQAPGARPRPATEPDMTQADMKTGINDPRYGVDEDFTNQVRQQIMGSKSLDAVLETRVSDNQSVGTTVSR